MGVIRDSVRRRERLAAESERSAKAAPSERSRLSRECVMAQILQFIRPEKVFDSETTAVLAAAYERAISGLRARGQPEVTARNRRQADHRFGREGRTRSRASLRRGVGGAPVVASRRRTLCELGRENAWTASVGGPTHASAWHMRLTAGQASFTSLFH